MKKKIAIKRLTRSDLTLFEWQFRVQKAGNQKAINLNANIFAEKLFPALSEISISRNRFPIDLHIYGPGITMPHNLQRKIIKGQTYKNWRLNGEFIHNPLEEPERYNILQEGDFLIFDFYGVEIPTSAKVFLIAKNNSSDNTIHTEITKKLGNFRMMEVAEKLITELITRAGIPEDHPLSIFNSNELIEEIAISGATVNNNFTSVGRTVQLSIEDLQNARINAVNTGMLGEQLINEYLSNLQQEKKIDYWEWTSIENAVSPFDFKLYQGNAIRLVDVKSTSGAFQRKIHISLNELKQMALGKESYDIYRVYEISSTGKMGKLKIARDLREFAKSILEVFKKLPDGIFPSSVTIDHKILKFGEELDIVIHETTGE